MTREALARHVVDDAFTRERLVHDLHPSGEYSGALSSTPAVVRVMRTCSVPLLRIR